MATKKNEQTDEELLRSKIREVTEEDREKLETFSYSKIDTYKSCAQKFKICYRDKKRSQASAIYFDIGTLCHKILEIKGRMKIENKEVDYDYLKNIFENGVIESTDKGEEKIIGIKEIKKKYFEDFYSKDNVSGATYKQKCDLFINTVIHNMLEDEDWKCLDTEKKFEFVYCYGMNEDGSPKEVIIMGFIDLLMCKIDGEIINALKICDYKTSKKKYDEKEMSAPLQMFTYCLAAFSIYHIIPEQYMYYFILIGENQEACRKGYIKRGLKKLDTLLEKIEESDKTNYWKPSPCQLCMWCSYRKNNVNAEPITEDLCKYYSLWTPTDKNFGVNAEYEGENDNFGSCLKLSNEVREIAENTKKPKKKLIF